MSRRASMNELEISSYVSSYDREKGLFVEQIKQWREEKKVLERDINRKDKCLAGTAALLTLSKRVCTFS